jgi:lipocalin-like protein
MLLALWAACCLVPSSVYGQSLREQLQGTWTLVSWTRVVGTVEEPGLLGQDPFGQIMFAPDGRMCFNAMRRDRSPFGGRDFQAGTPEEKAAAYDSYIGLCGRYEVNESERSVALRLDVSLYPNWAGTTQKRFAEITGSRLRITTPPILSGGKQIVGTLVFERAK